MNLFTIVEVCKARHDDDGTPFTSCRSCIYYGKTCDHAKEILKVSKPFEYTK